MDSSEILALTNQYIQTESTGETGEDWVSWFQIYGPTTATFDDFLTWATLVKSTLFNRTQAKIEECEKELINIVNAYPEAITLFGNEQPQGDSE